ncbi:hypothetical protein N7466_007113 [Penicillium verhagenii]|uniref:uncharacterized protein n=1 Tax=Penicillium verhagenii TaxID=1562060 RepID=UPI00254529E5|nr:uncharacterized protein N7466_007113 [Penicillium verhagenii]KAJ5928157.1 hypothetical protein N7466_007113 [Penicillium verhagenii]
MPSVQSLIIPAVLSLAAAANARPNFGDLFGKRLVTNCPNEWTPVNYNGNDKCCHGVLSVEEDNVPNCCVMNYNEYNNADVHFSDCFPFCSGSDYGGPSVTWTSAPTCITRVPFSADGYSSIVSAAVSSGRSDSDSDSNSSTTSTTNGPASNEASPTSTSDYNGDSQATTYTADSESTYSDDSSVNAAPVATAGSVVGGVAFAAALLAL